LATLGAIEIHSLALNRMRATNENVTGVGAAGMTRVLRSNGTFGSVLEKSAFGVNTNVCGQVVLNTIGFDIELS